MEKFKQLLGCRENQGREKERKGKENLNPTPQIQDYKRKR